MRKKPKSQPKVISLFTCTMGLDLGFEKAGFQIAYTNDRSNLACKTIRKNRPSVPCDQGDISKISSNHILKKAGLKKGEVDVVIGGPPCQTFSTAGARKGLNDERGRAILEFIRVVKDLRPKFFVLENVAGLKSAPKKHMPFYDRIHKKEIKNENKLGSLFQEILKDFYNIRGYKTSWNIVNAADYGVPQNRKRLIIIGSRVTDPELLFHDLQKIAKWSDPKNVNVNKKNKWKTLSDALDGLQDDSKEFNDFPEWGKYLKYIPPGGCWTDLPKRVVSNAMGGAADSNDPKRKGNQGGRRGFLRRLSWDKPSPTLVTSPIRKGTCMCHPDEDRPLTVREYAKIQGFPANWKFVGTTTRKYILIGEAVPIRLSKVIAKTIFPYLSY